MYVVFSISLCLLYCIQDIIVSSVAFRISLSFLWHSGYNYLFCGILDIIFSSLVFRIWLCPLWYSGYIDLLCGIQCITLSLLLSSGWHFVYFSQNISLLNLSTYYISAYLFSFNHFYYFCSFNNTFVNFSFCILLLCLFCAHNINLCFFHFLDYQCACSACILWKCIHNFIPQSTILSPGRYLRRW